MNRSFFLGSIAALMLFSPALADSADVLGAFKNWTAYSTGSGDSKTCYAMSAPRATEPKNLKRGAIFLMVSDWPGRKVKAEPQIVLGYPVKENAPAALAIGAAKFAFFARGTGSAWLQQVGDTGRLIDTLGKGVSAVASGVSARGTKTTDTYSLAGFPDALAKIHDVCKM